MNVWQFIGESKDSPAVRNNNLEDKESFANVKNSRD